MPELPEVETMRRGILGVKGGRIARVEKVRCRRKPIRIEPAIAGFRRRATDQEIIEVGRRGKRVVLRLANDHRLIFEPRMTGLVLVTDPPTREHLRLRIKVQGSSVAELMYWDRRGLGSVRLLSPAAFEDELGPSRLGPDALEVTG
ncbi:MAG: formamidopyrimidine-DNA glycosylase, partial [Pirellulales bacterium]|nr:formamidopyrimidine-DNA glycosylase [Pirellulales bacterium]